MSYNKKSTILIAGGGTSGWSTAAMLSSLKNVNIVILEPSTIPTLGVGESTIPHIHYAHKKMEFDVFKSAEWLDSVDGTVKFSIEFKDFYTKNHEWVHPFFDAYGIDRAYLSNSLIHGVNFDTAVEQKTFMFNKSTAGIRRQRGFVSNESWFKTSGCTKEAAFHMNAIKYAEYLKSKTLTRTNVTLYDAHIVKVNLDETGSVSNIITNEGTTLNADFYIDCTGSHSVLINAMNEPWIDASDRLFVDGAWLAQLPYSQPEVQLRNTTYCEGLSSGWVFNIPLQSRVGTGYIFSSGHQKDQAAADEFAEHLHTQYGYDKDKLSFRRLKFKTGYRKRQWVNNVVAIGMSNFFCEPLESTAIAMANSSALCFREVLQNLHVPLDITRDRFNDSQWQLANSVIDFVEMHYTLTQRQDSEFWQDYYNKPFQPHQQEFIDIYRKSANNKTLDSQTIKECLGRYSMFCNLSYAMMFYGNGLLPKSCISDNYAEPLTAGQSH